MAGSYSPFQRQIPPQRGGPIGNPNAPSWMQYLPPGINLGPFMPQVAQGINGPYSVVKPGLPAQGTPVFPQFAMPNVGMPQINAPRIGISPSQAFSLMGQGITGPIDRVREVTFAPRGNNEGRADYAARMAITSPIRAVKALGDTAAAGSRAFARETINLGNWLSATPDSDLKRAFTAMIGQESGGDQSAVSKKGAIGVAQVMPGTGPEAAKLAGLPWDPQRYKNDPAYNAAIGFAYFKKKVQENNGDVIKGMAAYNAGQGRLQQATAAAAKKGGTWMDHMPPETQGYVPSVLQRMGALSANFGAAAPGFNAQPYLNAQNAVDQATALLKKPVSVPLTETPIPDRPAPQEFAAPDFAAGDAALEASRPQDPFSDPKEKNRMLKQQFFNGIGQAMASLSGGEGIGTMLMKMGAGALMGRAKGEEMVDQRETEFQREMQLFNRALANREDQKAAQSANVLNQNIQQRNQHADEIWADNAAKIKAHNPQVVGDSIVSYTKDPSKPDDPNAYVFNRVPIGFGLDAEAIMKKAEIGLTMGQAQAESARFAYSSQQATARTALGLAVQTEMAQGGGQASMEGYLTEGAMRARAAVQTGSWRGIFKDPRRAQQLENDASAAAYTALGIDASKGPPMLEGNQAAQYKETFEDMLTQRIYNESLRLNQFDRLLTNPMAGTSLITQRSGTQRTSSRTDWRGRTTSSTNWSLDE